MLKNYRITFVYNFLIMLDNLKKKSVQFDA